MFINPKEAIKNGWIQGNIPDKNIQPNAIDFALDEIKLVTCNNAPPFVGERKKEMSPLLDVLPMFRGDGTQFWSLDSGRVYDGTSNFYVDLPSGIAAILYTRSTLTRNGVILASGLYDSGFKGHIGFTIYPLAHTIELEIGVRVGQIAFVSSESAGLYAGGWNHEQGTHYTENK